MYVHMHIQLLHARMRNIYILYMFDRYRRHADQCTCMRSPRPLDLTNCNTPYLEPLYIRGRRRSRRDAGRSRSHSRMTSSDNTPPSWATICIQQLLRDLEAREGRRQVQRIRVQRLY